MRISEKVCIPMGYNFLVILVGCFYYDANIQKISDKWLFFDKSLVFMEQIE